MEQQLVVLKMASVDPLLLTGTTDFKDSFNLILDWIVSCKVMVCFITCSRNLVIIIHRCMLHKIGDCKKIFQYDIRLIFFRNSNKECL